jgi:hypothetical protein
MTADVEIRAEWVRVDPFSDLFVPEPLQFSLNRHRENLARLVMSLQSVGMTEAQIETSVAVVVSSYKDELLRAIKAMVA